MHANHLGHNNFIFMNTEQQDLKNVKRISYFIYFCTQTYNSFKRKGCVSTASAKWLHCQISYVDRQSSGAHIVLEQKPFMVNRE